MASAQEVKVEVGDGFPAIGAVVDDQPVAAFVQLELATHPLGGGEKMAEDGMIFRGNRGVAGVMFFGDEKDMNGGLWGDIAESQDVIVLVDDIGGDFSIDDALENRLGHGADYQMVSSRREGLRV